MLCASGPLGQLSLLFDASKFRCLLDLMFPVVFTRVFRQTLVNSWFFSMSNEMINRLTKSIMGSLFARREEITVVLETHVVRSVFQVMIFLWQRLQEWNG